MPAPTQTPVTTPTVVPSTTPTPWPEQWVSPDEVCDEQHRELASPDVAP